MESNENKTAGRIIYTLLTFTAVVILFVTLYTFFGASNRDEDMVTTPDSAGAVTTDSILPPTNVTPGINAPVGDKDGGDGPLHNTEKLPETTNGEDTVPTPDTSKSDIDVSSKEDASSLSGEATLGDRKLTPPIKGIVTKGHDTEKAVFSVTMNDYRVHCGIDIEGNIDDSVVACGAGVISDVQTDPFMGTCVTVDLGGKLTAKYCNLSPELPEEIKVGASVSEGQTIGKIGESAIIEIGDSAHLHFELLYDGNHIDPLSVLKYEPAESFEDQEG